MHRHAFFWSSICTIIPLVASAVSLPRNDISESKMLAHSTCSAAIRSQLDQWETKRRWERLLENRPSERAFQTPTSQIGVWLALTSLPGGEVEAVRLSPERFVRLRWKAANCLPVVEAVEAPRLKLPAAERFTDHDLRVLIDQAPRGIVYAWSPEMPHSLAGIDVMKAAAKQAGLPLTLVLDPFADETAAKAALAAKGLIDKDRRRIASIELFRRGMAEHYPAVLLYRDRKIVRYAYAGYNSTAAYRSFFRQSFALK